MTDLAETRETVYEVAPGVFQLRIPMPDNRLGYTLPYIITGPEGRFMVDTGLRSKEGIDALNDQLVGQLGIKPNSIDLVLLTHNHPDHTGLVEEVQKLTGARTAMHRVDWETNPFRDRRPADSKPESDQDETARSSTDGGTRDRMAEGMAMMRDWFIRHGVPAAELEGEMFRRRGRRGRPGGPERGDGQDPSTEESNAHGARSQRANGHASEPERSNWNPHGAAVKPDVLLEGGETFSTGTATVETIWTPGHTPGHVCFFDRTNRMIFTGDHILPVITSNVSTRLTSDDDPLGDYLDSIDKLRSLDVNLVLPAHQHHFADLPGRLAELDAHHDKRLAAVLAACRGPGRTGYEIASEVPWDVGTWDSMDDFLRRAALGETLSHLEYLRRRGRVRRFRDDPHAKWTTHSAE